MDVLNKSLGSQGQNGRQRGSGSFFNNANHFVVSKSTFIEHRSTIVQNFAAGTTGEQIQLYFQPMTRAK